MRGRCCCCCLWVLSCKLVWSQSPAWQVAALTPVQQQRHQQTRLQVKLKCSSANLLFKQQPWLAKFLPAPVSPCGTFRRPPAACQLAGTPAPNLTRRCCHQVLLLHGPLPAACRSQHSCRQQWPLLPVAAAGTCWQCCCAWQQQCWPIRPLAPGRSTAPMQHPTCAGCRCATDQQQLQLCWPPPLPPLLLLLLQVGLLLPRDRQTSAVAAGKSRALCCCRRSCRCHCCHCWQQACGSLAAGPRR